MIYNLLFVIRSPGQFPILTANHLPNLVNAPRSACTNYKSGNLDIGFLIYVLDYNFLHRTVVPLIGFGHQELEAHLLDSLTTGNL